MFGSIVNTLVFFESIALSNVERVQSWRKRTKQKLVEIAGGRCVLCGYERCVTALEFHHIDPTSKDFNVTGSRDTRSFASMIAEIRKCVLVCANCHREIHFGLVDVDELSGRQIIDDDIISKYTTELEAVKAANKFKKGENSKIRKLAKLEWEQMHPHTARATYKVNWSQYDVFQLLEEHKSYEAVGRLLGVTGAAIKRRVKHLQSKM